MAASGLAAWVPRRGVDGGVTSARSNLNADIHLLDNAASRAGHLLESVAGTRRPCCARRDEIVAALALTAKPYFGDLASMTYGDVLGAVPRAVRDRARAALRRRRVGAPELARAVRGAVRRFAARLAEAESGPVEAVVDEAVAARTLLHPADAQFFLEVCDRPGKPVPFVPVLDAEVRRWYMADGLWQAQDDRLGVDEVFVIPGPEAVAGIDARRRAGRGVARAVRGGGDRAGGSPPVPRPRLADPGPAPEPLASLRAGGVVGELLAAQCVVTADGRTLPNPLWRLSRPATRSTSSATWSPSGLPRRPFESVVIEPTATTCW